MQQTANIGLNATHEHSVTFVHWKSIKKLTACKHSPADFRSDSHDVTDAN